MLSIYEKIFAVIGYISIQDTEIICDMDSLYLEYITNDIDEMFADYNCGCNNFRYIQLSPGPLGYKGRYVFLDKARIMWNRYDQRILFTEVPDDETFSLGIVLSADSNFYLNSSELKHNSVVLFQPHQEMEYVNPTCTESLIISLDPILKNKFGLSPEKIMIKNLSLASVNKFVTECKRITSVAMKTDLSNSEELKKKTRSSLTNELIIALVELLDYWVAENGNLAKVKSASRAYALIKEVSEIYTPENFSPSTSIKELAHVLGVSERTIHYAYKNWMGLSPQAYFYIRQLNIFREKLLSTNPHRGAISKIALDCGFTHMGRLSGMYKRQFGERPIDTLRTEKKKDIRTTPGKAVYL